MLKPAGERVEIIGTNIFSKSLSTGASLVAQMVKNLSVMPETLVQSLEWGTLLAWRISWTEEPGGLQFKGLQRIRHDWGWEDLLENGKAAHSIILDLENSIDCIVRGVAKTWMAE